MTEYRKTVTRPAASRKITSTARLRRTPRRVSMRTAGSRLIAMNSAISTRTSTALVVYTAAAASRTAITPALT
jgi:hypothetical protein